MTTTSQACERVYKAQPKQIGRLRNTLSIAAGARINWLPQETILFNNSALNRRLSVDMAADASFLMVEPLVFGRVAMGETLSAALFQDRIDIRRDNTLIYTDATNLRGDIDGHLARRFIANGAKAMASIVLVDKNAAAQLAKVRSMLSATAGASLLADDILVMRLLAEDSYALRQDLLPVLTLLNGCDLPRCWMI